MLQKIIEIAGDNTLKMILNQLIDLSYLLLIIYVIINALSRREKCIIQNK